MVVIVNVAGLFNKLLLKLSKLNFVLAKERSLIDVFVDTRLVLNLLGARGELEGRDRFSEALACGRDHGHHGGFAVAAKGILEQAGQL